MNPLIDQLRWSQWALERHVAVELDAYLHRHQPRTVVEAGSGSSTVLLAAYAYRTHAQVVTLEHDPIHAARTRALLSDHGLAGVVTLREAPLEPWPTPMRLRQLVRWYQAPLPPRIDFALVDGPPGSVGRHAALPALMPHLAGRWEVWLDDAHRPDERTCLESWQKHFGVQVTRVPMPKGLARINPSGTAATDVTPVVDGRDVTITVVTGQRPDLLAMTVGALRNAAPGLLETAHVIVLHNGGDPATADVLAGCRWINDLDVHRGRMMPVGPAVSRLVDQLPDDREFWLHLEDDWVAATCAPGWLDTAREALSDHRIGQVRLRHRGEQVRDRHMVSGEPIRWRDTTTGLLAGDAHYTLNPALMRTVDARAVWPATSEPDAMRRFLAGGWRVGHLTPGVFHHIGGGGRSLQGH